MALRQLRPRNTCTPIACTLPADLMLEIVARSNLSTLVHCAATNKDLRREILSPPFIRRVSQQGGIVPPRIHAYLRTDVDLEASLPPLSLANPATPAAAAFFEDHLFPFVARNAADLLAGYCPVTSRGGLVLLRRRNIYRHMKSTNCSNLCVYDLITGHRTFFADPPNVSIWWHACVLLSARDDIGCPFRLLVAKVDHRYADNECSIRVQIATPLEVGGASCGPFMKYFHIGLPSEGLEYNRDANVVHGGVIHFPMLTCNNEMTLTYNIHTEKLGTVKLPHINSKASQRHLGTSPDRMLRLLTADGFKISVWLQPIGGDWALETVIDMEEKLRSLDPDIPPGHAMIEFMDEPGEKSGPVLLRMHHPDMWLHDDELPIIDVGDGGPLINFDLETKEMHRQNPASSLAVLLEIDMVSHLQSMRIFL